MGKALRGALAGIADRLEQLLREEARRWPPSRARRRRAAWRGWTRRRRPSTSPSWRTTCCCSTISIGRQRLEDLASLGKELTDAHQRLQDLLARYKRTKDEGLRRQLEREARDLRARIADLAQKIAAVKARNDVPEEWRNLPDMKALAEQAQKLDDLLEKGDDADLAKALAQLGDDLRGDAQDARSERGRVRRRALPAGEPGGRRDDEEDRRPRGRRARAAEGDARRSPTSRRRRSRSG